MPSATQVKFRRGTAAQMATFTGALGEVCVTTDTHQLVVHDGVTAGGFVVGGGNVTGANYGGSKPPALSSSITGAITIDTSTGRQWQWFSNDWH